MSIIYGYEQVWRDRFGNEIGGYQTRFSSVDRPIEKKKKAKCKKLEKAKRVQHLGHD